jgi:5-methylcytosine-specific restriction endonuclease McrA
VDVGALNYLPLCGRLPDMMGTHVSEAKTMNKKTERRPVRVLLSNGETRYEVRADVYLNGKRKRLRRRFRTVDEAEAFFAETPECKRARRYKISDEQYREAVRQSHSIAGALRLLGVVPEGGNYRVFHRAVKRLGLDTSHFAGQSWSRGAAVRHRVRPIEDYLSNTYSIQSDRLRRRLINEGVLARRCSDCKLDTWMDQPIPLELDHIDGNHQNNALDNLRLLCPNCHSLTPTFRGKNKRSATTLDSAA